MKEFQRINRLPPYVLNIVNQLKIDARKKGEDIIDFGMGNPDQKTPDHIIDKMKECANKDNTHRYSSSKGIPRLRKAISNWYLEKFSVDIDFEKEEVEVDAYLKEDGRCYDGCGWYRFYEVEIMLDALQVRPTKLAKKIYPNAKEEDGWLIIENL